MADSSREHRLEEVLDRTESILRAYIAGLGVPLDCVDDVAQEAYLGFYKTQDQIPADATDLGWLKGIARNQSLKYFRASRREQDRRLAAVVELLGQPEHEPSETIPGLSIDRLRSCLDRLPERSRTLVGLRYERHLRSDAIAARLRTNGAAIRMALTRIRTILRDCMTRSAGEETGA